MLKSVLDWEPKELGTATLFLAVQPVWSVTMRPIEKQSRGAHMQLTAILTPNELAGFTAANPETGTTTQGDTVEEALANLKEATELYLEVADCPEVSSAPHGGTLLTTIEVRTRAAAA